MNDRYLFRGRQTDKEKWIYGVPVKGTGEDDSEILIIESVFKCDEYACRGCEFTPVIPSTVGQYTGLKDKNGKRIFEGDIVIYERDEEIGQIAYHENEAMFVVEFDTWLTDFDHMYGKDLEVIGNIHDNPELLEVER